MKKVIVINLNEKTVVHQSLDYDTKINYDESDLVFKAPRLCGYGVLGLNRMDIYSMQSSSKVGGYFGHYLKTNGYDEIIVRGNSEKPVYVYIDRENISIKDASEIYSYTKDDTEKYIRNDLNEDDIEIAQVGIAACNGIDFSRIVINHKSCGKNGLGKFMGQKKLKAIALKKQSTLVAKEPEVLNKLNEKIAKNLGDSVVEDYYNEKNNCFGCAVNCSSTSVKKITKRGFSKEEAEKIDSICNYYGMDSCIFADLVNPNDEFEAIAKDIVFNNKPYELKKSKKKDKIHEEKNEFEELGFCRFLVKKNILENEDIEVLKKSILG